MDKQEPQFLTKDEVLQILEAQARYLASGGKAGVQADLSLYIIEDFDFSGWDLQDVHISNSILTRCRFIGTTLVGADFDQTRAPEADFRNAILVKAEVHETDLHGTCFDGADMARATVIASNLCGATFRHANLLGATFLECDLRKADFDGVNLDGTRFDNCLVDTVSGEREASGAY